MSKLTPPSRNTFLRVTLMIALLLSCGCALSQEAASIEAAATALLREQTAGLPGKATIELGKVLDSPRNSACKRWQAYLPDGARPWGHLSVGLRCVSGAQLTLYLSAEVRVSGPYLVAARAISPGHLIDENDFRVVEGMLTDQAQDVLTRKDQVLGQRARVLVAAERALRGSFLAQEALVVSGQPVKLVAEGSGFAVSSEGLALASGAKGQNVRLRLPNGQVISGIVVDKGVVQIKY